MVARFWIMLSLTCVLLLSACDDDLIATGTPPAETDSSVTPSPTVPPSDTTPQYTQCVWNWAQEPLPDVTTQFQEALDAAEIAYNQAGAYAFGENCLNDQGQIQYFATMETDFTLTLAAEDVTPETLGNLIAPVLALVVNQFPTESTPGPQPGRIEFQFFAGSENQAITVEQERAVDVVQRGLSGAGLWEALAG